MEPPSYPRAFLLGLALGGGTFVAWVGLGAARTAMAITRNGHWTVGKEFFGIGPKDHIPT